MVRLERVTRHPGRRVVSRRERIRGLIDTAGLTPFLNLVRQRIEEAGPENARSVTLTGLTLADRQAVANLFGWEEVPGCERRVSLHNVDAVLKASAIGTGLIEVVEAAGDAALINRREIRDRARAVRDDVWARAREAVADRPELVAWVEDLRSTGLVLRFAGAEHRKEADLLQAATKVARLLPRQGVQLQVLATETTGDSHALDHGRGLSAVVLRAAASIAGWSSVPAFANGRRQLWSAVGVSCDPLSNDVLALGLRPLGDDRLARHLRESSDDGEPRRVTLRELTRSALTLPGGVIFVCENPTVVVGAAEQLGAKCPPLVCLDGMPTTAALDLLGRAPPSGASIRFHGDFDWAGVRIGNVLCERIRSAEPWRFSASDYVAAAVRATEPLPPPEARLEASWDPTLIPALRKIGVAVYEEHVLELLMRDLAAS